jgi:hypothetical protein
MRKSRTVSIALAIAFCVCLASSQQKPSGSRSFRGNARYTVYKDFSRFLLLFKGPVQHTEKFENGKLIVDLTGISKSVSPNASVLQFKDGLVRSAAVGSVVDGRNEVVLTLRNGSERYQIRRDDAQGILRIDIFPNPFAVKPPALALSSPPKGKVAKVSERSTPNTHQIVDLRALVRNQIEEAQAKAPSSEAAVQASNTLQSRPIVDFQNQDVRSALPWLLMISASLIVTVMSIVIMLVRAFRRAKQQRSAEMLRASLQRFRTSSSQSIEHRHIEDDRPAFPDVQEPREEPDEFGSPAATLAERYQRSRGDIELAWILGDQNKPTRKVKVIKASKIRAKGKVTLARKLGTGKGELDLAAKLHKLEEESIEKETVV